MKKINYFALILLFLSISSCKKYEEGPNFSLRTKKARLSGEWYLTESTLSNTSIKFTDKDIDYIIKNDQSYTYQFNLGFLTTKIEGKWEFNDKKSSVIFTPNDKNIAPTTYEILMLKHNMLKLKLVKGGTVSIQTFNNI
jgi:hypothetical protein